MTNQLDDLLATSRSRRRLPEPAMRRLLRQRACLSQLELAGVLKVDRATVSRYESGQRAPRGDRLTRYIEVLDRLAAP